MSIAISRRGKVLARVAVSVVLLAVLVFAIDWNETLDRYREASWYLLVCALLSQVAVRILGAARWWTLLRAHAGDIPISRLVRPTFVGGALSLVLPTSLGGDVYRFYHAHRELGLSAAAISSVVADRLFGLALLVAAVCLAMPWSPFRRHIALEPVLLGVLVAGCLGLLFFVRIRRSDTGEADRPTRIRALVAMACDALGHLGEYLHSPVTMARYVAVGVVMLFLQVSVFVILGDALSTGLSWFMLFTSVPTLLVVSSLPISIGGLGVREITGAGLLTLAGVDVPTAASLSVLFGAVWVLSALPGVLYLLHPGERRMAVSTGTAAGQTVGRHDPRG